MNEKNAFLYNKYCMIILNFIHVYELTKRRPNILIKKYNNGYTSWHSILVCHSPIMITTKIAMMANLGIEVIKSRITVKTKHIIKYLSVN